MWFKVVLNKDLSIASCEQVANAFDDAGRHVIYCEADDKAGALKYAKHLADARRNSRERRAMAKANGRCTSCGHGFDSPKHAGCKARKRVRSTAVRDAELASLPRPEPKKPGPQVHQFGSIRERILTEVREHYVRMTREEFFAWLEAEIKAASWRRTA